MTDPEIDFTNPPPRGRGAGATAGQTPLGKWFAALRTAPGKWARYPVPISQGVVHLIHKGKHWGIKEGEYEACARTEDGERYLYARFIGEA